ncbi:MAG: ATP-binding protein [Bacillota bacterium]
MRDLLFGLNPWWRTATVDSAPDAERTELAAIVEELDNLRRATIITGPRRTGKSTLLMQTIRQLIAQGVAAGRICFLDCAEPGLQGITLSAIWNEYFSEILSEPLAGLTSTVYIVIDEIHFSPDWQLYIKSVIDKRLKVKFLISGSSATALFNNAKDSLMGRTHTVKILPLTFRQFLRFKNHLNTGEKIPLLDLPEPPELADFASIKQLCAEFDVRYYSPYALTLFSEYLAAGGYPEYFLSKNMIVWQKYLTEDIIDYGLYRDIVAFYKVRQPDLLKKIMFYVAANQGAALPVATLAMELSADRSTVNEYLEYLQDAAMLTVVSNYSANIGKTLRKNKKYYVSDCGIRNALLKRRDFGPAEEGHLAETAALSALRKTADIDFGAINYYRENSREIDFIVDTNNAIIPVEVKYRNSIAASDIKTLVDFVTQRNLPAGIVLTKTKLQISEKIAFVPVWLV